MRQSRHWAEEARVLVLAPDDLCPIACSPPADTASGNLRLRAHVGGEVFSSTLEEGPRATESFFGDIATKLEEGHNIRSSS